MTDSTTANDHWSSKAYSEDVAPFVAKLTTKVVSLLDPQPTDRILDVGCGDGVLTERLSQHCASIHGIDSSANMIASALAQHSTQNTTYSIIDATTLPSTSPSLSPQSYTKIFSNAALHWILHSPAHRAQVLKSLHDLLLPGGTFAAEFGGHGNCAEVHAALIAALVHRGVNVEVAREACPWFFPGEDEVRELWASAGFIVDSVEMELRQTPLPQGDVGGWVELFGDSFLRAVPEGARAGVVEEVKCVLESVGRVGGSGSGGEFRVNYVRCRVLAKRG